MSDAATPPPLQSTRAILTGWNAYYSSQDFGIGVECSRCKQWRIVTEYEESYQVPEQWFCSMTIINGKKGDCSIPSTLTQDDFVAENYVPGSLVWAKAITYPWWPAMVEDDPDEEEYHRLDENGREEYHVVYITDKPRNVRRSWIPVKFLTEYIKPPNKGKHTVKKNYAPALRKSKEIADTALPMSLTERLKKFSFAELSNLKFPVVRKEVKVPLIPVKKNKRGRHVSVIPNKRRRHASAAVDTTNGNTTEDAVRISETTAPDMGNNVENIAIVSEVSHAVEISADPSTPQTAAVNTVSSEIGTMDQTSNLPSTIDDSEQLNLLNNVSEELDSEAAGMPAFDKDLELHSLNEDELSPLPSKYYNPLPESLQNREMGELFSDVIIDDDELKESEDGASPCMEKLVSSNVSSPQNEPPISKKDLLNLFVQTDPKDTWDINIPNLIRPLIWSWVDARKEKIFS